jgi:hypothetical protein
MLSDKVFIDEIQSSVWDVFNGVVGRNPLPLIIGDWLTDDVVLRKGSRHPNSEMCLFRAASKAAGPPAGHIRPQGGKKERKAHENAT